MRKNGSMNFFPLKKQKHSQLAVGRVMNVRKQKFFPIFSKRFVFFFQKKTKKIGKTYLRVLTTFISLKTETHIGTAIHLLFFVPFEIVTGERNLPSISPNELERNLNPNKNQAEKSKDFFVQKTKQKKHMTYTFSD